MQRKKTNDEKLVAYIEYEVKKGRTLDDVLHGLEYIRKSEAFKLTSLKIKTNEKKETIHIGKVPKGLLSTEEAARILQVAHANVVATMRRYNCKGVLYRNQYTRHIKRYFEQGDLEKVKNKMLYKHKKAGPVIAFNPNVKNGHIYHFSTIYHCKSLMEKKFGVKLTIEEIKQMLANGNEKENWYIEELA